MRAKKAGGVLLAAWLMCGLLAGCGMAAGDRTGDRAEGVAGTVAPGAADAGDADAVAGGGEGDEGKPGEGGQTIRPGQLTAGAWDDNAEYSFFLSLFGTEQGQDGETLYGVFSGYAEGADAWGMSLFRRVEVRVKDRAGAPAKGAKVVLETGGERMVACSGADGKAYLFPENAGEYTVSAGYDALLPAVAGEDGSYEVTLSGEAIPYAGLDICFMIDTTGSMGDELSYLQAEMQNVIGRVRSELSQTDISLALVFYRDEQDEYVTRTADFSSDISAQQAFLAGQQADGGADYPEAVDRALEEALGLSWRAGTKKILVPVLDAPPHAEIAGQDVRALYGEKIRRAAERGISVLPVAASGADVCTQYLMRSAALVTGGKYVFLTDDSGIGLPHDKPAVGEYTVEYLDSCLVRLIAELYSGVSRPAVDWRQEDRG